MKISFDWLKELTDIPWSLDATVEKLASLGFPVASLDKVGVQVSNVVAVKILSVSKHPNADRLQIAQVTDGKNERTIVCGAPNIAPDQIVPCAVPGARLPNGLEITVSKIRGIESQGMLCSERELGLSTEHAGILQLPATAPLGREVSEIFGGQDTILDIEVTPNRPDLMSHVGVARELAALSGKPLKIKISKFPKVASGAACDIKIEDKALCSRYMGKLFHQVQVGPSPDWMVRRLKACGIRSISNVVDITNYVLLEWGHPLHAFDFNKLNGRRIVVRKAGKNEKIAALDGKTYELTADDLVVADAAAPVAIAGIMGGEEAGVVAATTDILLESAVFDPATVRQTSRRLGLRSESSIRFEKGTDAATAEFASLRAAQLIQELAGGKPGRAADEVSKKEKKRAVSLRSERLDALLGKPVSKSDVAIVLKRLNLKPAAGKEGWKCEIPSYRKDLIEEVDVIEEVARIIGYDSIPSSLGRLRLGHMDAAFKKWDDAALVDRLQGLGISETMTTSFCAAELAEQFGVKRADLTMLANPLSQEEAAFRPLLAPNLLKAVVRNLHHQQTSIALFEIGAAVSQGREEKKIAIVLAGESQPRGWQNPGKPVDAFTIKGVLESLNASFQADLKFQQGSKHPFLHPHQAWEILHQGASIGWAGALHPALAQQLDVTTPCVLAEFTTGVFGRNASLRAATLPKYPFVERDIAVVVEKKQPWEALRREAEKAGGDLLVDIAPFDIFSGGSLSADQKSVAFRLRLQHPEHTLTDAEITGAVDKIKDSLQKNCGAQLR